VYRQNIHLQTCLTKRFTNFLGDFRCRAIFRGIGNQGVTFHFHAPFCLIDAFQIIIIGLTQHGKFNPTQDTTHAPMPWGRQIAECAVKPGLDSM
jgi:hypothetical protein